MISLNCDSKSRASAAALQDPSTKYHEARYNLRWALVLLANAANAQVWLNRFGEDLCSLHLEIGYSNYLDGKIREAYFKIACLNIAYVSLSRLSHHTPGSGAIYEAYLHDSSDLLEKFLSNKLESKAGSLIFEADTPPHSLKHLDIVGEITVNIICEEVRSSTATTLPPEWRPA